MKRNSRLIDYSFRNEKHFMFQDRPEFYSRYGSSGHIVYSFSNDFLKTKDEKDYLEIRGTGTRFDRTRERIGTIQVLTNLKVLWEIVYVMLESWADIERSL